MKETTKLWGKSLAIFSGDTSELQRIEVVAGGFCSIHRHERKSNLFFVESGELLVYAIASGPSAPACHRLGPGESYIVPPGVLHQFEATKPTVAYEHYFTDRTIDPLDIVRYTTGGISEPCRK